MAQEGWQGEGFRGVPCGWAGGGAGQGSGQQPQASCPRSGCTFPQVSTPVRTRGKSEALSQIWSPPAGDLGQVTGPAVPRFPHP